MNVFPCLSSKNTHTSRFSRTGPSMASNRNRTHMYRIFFVLPLYPLLDVMIYSPTPRYSSYVRYIFPYTLSSTTTVSMFFVPLIYLFVSLFFLYSCMSRSPQDNNAYSPLFDHHLRPPTLTLPLARLYHLVRYLLRALLSPHPLIHESRKPSPERQMVPSRVLVRSSKILYTLRSAILLTP